MNEICALSTFSFVHVCLIMNSHPVLISSQLIFFQTSRHLNKTDRKRQQKRTESVWREKKNKISGLGGGGTSSCWRQSLRFKCKQAAEMQTLTAEEEHTTYTPPGNCASQDGQQAASFCQTVHRLFLPAVGDHTRTYGGAWWRRGGTDGHVQPIFCRISHRQSSGPEKHKSTEKSNSWWLNMMDAPQGGGNLSKKAKVLWKVSPKNYNYKKLSSHFSKYWIFSPLLSFWDQTLKAQQSSRFPERVLTV